MDFLLHERAEPTLFRGGGIPLHLERLALGLIASEINDVVAGGGDGDDLVVCHFHRILGVVNEPGHVGAEEVFTLAQANDQRGIPAGGNNPIREIRVQRQQRERTLQPVAGQPHGFGEVALAGAVHKVGQQGGGHLGVGFGLKGVALFCQLGFQFRKVLNDAIVHNSKFAAIHHVRVSVGIGWPTMGGPPGVPNAHHRLGQRVGGDHFVEGSDLPGLFPEAYFSLVEHGNTGRVVAAIFQAS